jgi:hypothetical protein
MNKTEDDELDDEVITLEELNKIKDGESMEFRILRFVRISIELTTFGQITRLFSAVSSSSRRIREMSFFPDEQNLRLSN